MCALGAAREEDGLSASRTATREQAPARYVSAAVLGLLLPGLGHFYLRRRVKGFIFLGCLMALFGLGLAMGSRLDLYGLDDVLALVFSVFQVALGLPYFGARYLGYHTEGIPTAVTYEYGNTFTAVAGLLNILVILDAMDTARGYKP